MTNPPEETKSAGEYTPETDFVPNQDNYVLPEGAEWVDPPCPGSVGSTPNLVDVQNQLNENTSAYRESRQPQALAIRCPFCNGFHLAMQPPVESLIGGEVAGSPATGVPVTAPPDPMAIKMDTNTNYTAEPETTTPVESETTTDPTIEDIFTDDSSSSGSSASN